MAKVLVTGGTGFIGSKLVDRLLKEGHEVRVLSRKKKSSDRANLEYMKADYTDKESLVNCVRGCSAVFHLAAAIFAFNKKGFERANVTTTENLVYACNVAGDVDKFILVSSQAAAGFSPDKSRPLTETDEPRPVSDYGRTKLGAERALAGLNNGTKTVILRPPIVYGKNDSGVSKIAAWVKRGIMVNTSSGDTYFSFIYVDDLIRAIYIAYTNFLAENNTYFVCENRAYTWKYFIKQMAKAMGKRFAPVMFTAPKFVLYIVAFFYELFARIFRFEPALNYDKVREATIKGHWICTSSKWIALTEQKFTTLDDGLKKTFEK
ncbi:Nucleoside-diphosphate-sugar epimerase [Parelusimicrobium proximum]|uniref:NAD-dependent epimerase/dehydratase family protein n=1 Tax=Parelusimicrobium proximum TaxID=3228953 RepID=UPI003D16B9EE